ncbi:MAG: hypothetical protein CL908_19455 [Deltaproteobacteria bacterium]|nr:hypothetical protein [Deltaproteobacteria bacterium]
MPPDRPGGARLGTLHGLFYEWAHQEDFRIAERSTCTARLLANALGAPPRRSGKAAPQAERRAVDLDRARGWPSLDHTLKLGPRADTGGKAFGRILVAGAREDEGALHLTAELAHAAGRVVGEQTTSSNASLCRTPIRRAASASLLHAPAGGTTSCRPPVR